VPRHSLRRADQINKNYLSKNKKAFNVASSGNRQCLGENKLQGKGKRQYMTFVGLLINHLNKHHKISKAVYYPLLHFPLH
jgi:hypothetical protein